jgi:hypothetical protein
VLCRNHCFNATFNKQLAETNRFQMCKKDQESVLRSTVTSFRLSGAALTCVGKSKSMFGGAKYMCSDIIQMIIPEKSCSMTQKMKQVYWWYQNQPAYVQKGFYYLMTSECMNTCKVGLKLKRYTDQTIVSSIAIDVAYTWEREAWSKIL